MEKLSKRAYVEGRRFDRLPERIIQFGEGNFLRGFVDWMVQQMNKQDLFMGRVVAIQPTPHGKVVPKLNVQDGLYTVVLRGIEDGVEIDHVEIISSITRGINPYTNWEEVLKLAESKDIQFVFSNTTEAGLSYVKEEYEPEKSPLSFPGKLTAFLFHRFQVMGDVPNTGLKIFPCELLENNGDLLKQIVLQISADWNLPTEFINWVTEHNRFCNTLVDRIVTGFPKDNLEEFMKRLGYEDKLLTVGEPFHLFAIEADEETALSIPFHLAGLNVKWGDVKPFRELKVRILNGAHTMMFAAAYLSGANTVLEAMQDKILREYIINGIYQEILPVLPMEIEQKKDFANSVVERFRNPFTHHQLLDLGLNAVFKYRVRVLPTLIDSAESGHLPSAICFSLAALIAFYRGELVKGNLMIGYRGEEEYSVREQTETLQFFRDAWAGYQGREDDVKLLVETVLANECLWGCNLTEIEELTEIVSAYLHHIIQEGMKPALVQLLRTGNV